MGFLFLENILRNICYKINKRDWNKNVLGEKLGRRAKKLRVHAESVREGVYLAPERHCNRK